MSVWVFAEERSGSTWLCSAIAQRFSLSFIYTHKHDPHENAVHQTHNYGLLDKVEGTILRTARKDWYEQFLSYTIMVRYEWSEPFITKNRTYCFGQLLAGAPITVMENEVMAWLALKREREALWADRAQTIYYEDLIEGVAIPSLGIDKIGFSDGGVFQKIPYEKEDRFNNPDQIREWLCQRYDK